MNTAATVKLWDNILGYLIWDEKQNLGYFEYDSSFLKLGIDVAPITMPLNHSINKTSPYVFSHLDKKTFNGLPGLLSDSLPDMFGNKVIEKWHKYSSVKLKSLNPVDRLCFMGKRAMGALEFEPIIKVNFKNTENIQIDELAIIANQIFKDEELNIFNSKEDDVLHHIFQVGASAGGKRPKAIIGWNKQTGEVCSGQISIPAGFEHCLLKLDVDSKYPHGRVEYAYALMAKEFGINMSEVNLIDNGDKAYFITKRFDRIENRKLHLQTLCGLAHYGYTNSGYYSYDDVFTVFRRLELPYLDFEQLFKIMCFNVYAKNYDDHTKNLSFIMNNNGKWQFAPAYDLTFTHLPSEPAWFHKHEININGKTNNITKEDLIIIGKNNNIKNITQIIEQCEYIISQWSGFAQIAGISNNIKIMINNILANKK